MKKYSLVKKSKARVIIIPLNYTLHIRQGNLKAAVFVRAVLEHQNPLLV